MLLDAMDHSADRVIKALSKGPYERIEDPDIRTLWKQEGWRSSVKARHLIVALHDYFTHGAHQAQTDSHSPDEEAVELTLLTPDHPDAWTLAYSKDFWDNS